MKTTAIIVAGGTGSRLGSEIPKQFIEIGGRSILEIATGRFQDSPSVDQIVIVLPADRIDSFSRESFEKVTVVVSGGDTRAASVLAGLNVVDDSPGLVAVHDAARPLVTVEEIERTIEKAKVTGAACLVSKVTDTIKSVRGGEIAETLDRDKLRRALTPQIFETALLKKAFQNAELTGKVTDECYLVERLGHPIAVVEGRATNIKITNAEDLIFAEALLNFS